MEKNLHGGGRVVASRVLRYVDTPPSFLVWQPPDLRPTRPLVLQKPHFFSGVGKFLLRRPEILAFGHGDCPPRCKYRFGALTQQTSEVSWA